MRPMTSSDRIFNVVVGTAGHIDHGKSTLVERLTGVDPDRLPEEKARGLTIDLGFAPLELPDGRRVGIVDVPGHERLIKNMVAGATGIDVVVLVVAADDGVMPQTREHLTIIEILGIEHGLVAMTKADVVEAEMRELVREDIADNVAGTFLESAPIVEVSSITGEGIPDLVETLVQTIDRVEPRETSGVFRMPIQRIFSPKGFGTVITGIPVSGTVKVGDTLEVVPLGQRGRVRGLQAYKETSSTARAGHSTAVNLSDVDYRSVERGMVLAEPGYFEGATMYEAELRYLPAGRRPLVHQTPIRLHVGTAEALGRVHLLEKKSMEPGETSFVQFRLDDPVVAAPGDRFVLRLYSPMETIGGGKILGVSDRRLKTGKDFILERLRRKQSAVGDQRQLIEALLVERGYDTIAEKDIAKQLGVRPDEARDLVASLIDEDVARRASRAGQVLSTRQLTSATEASRRCAESYYRDHPRRLLMDKSYLRRELDAGEVFLADLLAAMASTGDVEITPAGLLRWRDFGPSLGEEEEAMRDAIEAVCQERLFTPPSPDELAAEKGWPEATTLELFDLLTEQGELRKVADGIYFHCRAMDEARRRLREHLGREGSMTAGDAKNILESSRKYSIPLLETLDREGFTVRKGDVRVLKEAGH